MLERCFRYILLAALLSSFFVMRSRGFERFSSPLWLPSRCRFPAAWKHELMTLLHDAHLSGKHDGADKREVISSEANNSDGRERFADSLQWFQFSLPIPNLKWREGFSLRSKGSCSQSDGELEKIHRFVVICSDVPLTFVDFYVNYWIIWSKISLFGRPGHRL